MVGRSANTNQLCRRVQIEISTDSIQSGLIDVWPTVCQDNFMISSIVQFNEDLFVQYNTIFELEEVKVHFSGK